MTRTIEKTEAGTYRPKRDHNETPLACWGQGTSETRIEPGDVEPVRCGNAITALARIIWWTTLIGVGVTAASLVVGTPAVIIAACGGALVGGGFVCALKIDAPTAKED